MHLLATIALFFAVLATQAQRPSISTLLSLTECMDTTCFGNHVRPMGFCQKGGNEEDGWGWFSCEHIINDSVADRARMTNLYFTGYEGSYYRQYSLGTRDTTYAILLTEEIERLGFKVEKRYPSGPGGSGELYESSEYVGLKIERQEKHSGSISPRSDVDPIDLPRAQPMDEEERKQLAKEIGVEEVQDWVIVHSVVWVFKIRVQK